MNRDQNTFEQIERYLNESLNAEERINFEQQMDADPELKQEVDLHQSLNTELSDTDALEFRKKLIKIGQNVTEQQPKKNFLSWRIAASLLVLLSLSTYLWLKPATGEDLFENYYKAYPVEDMVRGENSVDKDQVLLRYTSGNYSETLDDLKRLSSEDSNNETLQLYLGNCYLNLEREEEAITIFQDITPESNYYEAAQWYLALALIKENNFKEAAKSLNWLVKYDGLHKKSAAELLPKLPNK